MAEVPVKTGVQTTEFWITIIGNIMVVLQGMQGNIDGKWLVIVLAIMNGIYTIMRSLVKANASKV